MDELLNALASEAVLRTHLMPEHLSEAASYLKADGRSIRNQTLYWSQLQSATTLELMITIVRRRSDQQSSVALSAPSQVRDQAKACCIKADSQHPSPLNQYAGTAGDS